MNDQEIKKAISNINYGLHYEDCGNMVVVTKFAAHQAISALTQQLTNGWIPVSSELPSSDGRFEVTIKGSKGKRHVEICDFHKEAHGYKWGHRYDYPNVTAWRKRPEPYKEETE